MATLTETAYIARRSIKYGSVGLVGLTILWFVGTGLVNLWKAAHPTPPPPPTIDFGPLPALVFPESRKKVSEYQLQTPTGKLGTFPDRMYVYYAPVKRSQFLDPDKATDLARKLNFLFDPTLLSDTLYRWNKQDPIPQTLEVNIVSGWYDLEKQWQVDPSLLTTKRFVSDQQTILDAQSYLRLVGQADDDILGEEKVSYLQAQGDQLVPAISLSEADFVRIEMFRKPKEIIGEKKQLLASYPFFTPNPAKGLIGITISGSADNTKKVTEVNYKYTPISYDVQGEYPIKTAEQAFEELKTGKGYVASFNGSSTAVIRRVEIGYFDSLADQKYSMPIYVFTGDQNFVGYVSAVDETNIIGSEDSPLPSPKSKK